MYKFHIEGMIKEIGRILGLSQEDERLVRCALNDYWVDKVAMTWNTEDVYAVAADLDIEITKEQAIDALHFAFDNHNANQGINWNTIEFALNHVQRK